MHLINISGIFIIIYKKMKFGKDKSKLIEAQSIRKTTKVQHKSESIMSHKEDKQRNQLYQKIISPKNSDQIIQKSQLKKLSQKQIQKRMNLNKKQTSHKEDGITTSNLLKIKAKSPKIPHSPSAFTKGSNIILSKNIPHPKISSFKAFQDEDEGISSSKLQKQQKKQSTNITNLDVDALLLSEKLSKSKLEQLNSQFTTLQTKLKDQQQKTTKLKQQNQNLIKKLQKMQQLSDQNKKMLRQRIQSFNKEGENMRKMKNQIIDLEKVILSLKQENQSLKNDIQKLKIFKEHMKIQQNFIKISEGQSPNISQKSYLSYGQLPLYTIIKGQVNENNFFQELKIQEDFQIQQNQNNCKQIIKIVNNTNTNDSILSALMKDINQNPNPQYNEAQVQTDEMLQNYRDDSNYVEDSLQKLRQKQVKNSQDQNAKKLIDLKQSYQKSLKDVEQRFQFVIIKNYQKISQQQQQIFNLWEKLYQVSQIKNSQIENSKINIEIQQKQQDEQKNQRPSFFIYNPAEVFRFLSGKILSPLQYRQKIQQMHTHISELEQKLQNLEQKWNMIIKQNQVKFQDQIQFEQKQIKQIKVQEQQNQKIQNSIGYFQPTQLKDFRHYKFEIRVSDKQKYQQIKQLLLQQRKQVDLNINIEQNQQLEESQLLQQIDDGNANQENQENQEILKDEQNKEIQNENDQSSIII